MRSLGCERSVDVADGRVEAGDLFTPATWRAHSAPAAADETYPGLRPTGSWVLHPGGELRGLDPDPAGWRDRDTGEPVDLTGRRLVLAYGSNAATAKLLDREAKYGFFGGEPVIALRAAVFGWAAVWCDARRHDGKVVATLEPVPERAEVHPVLALTRDQLDAMDSWEGHPRFYCRTALEARVQWESGRWAEEDIEVYLGTVEERPVLVLDGYPALLAQTGYDEVDEEVDRNVRRGRR